MPGAARPINVREFIDERAVSPFQWLVGFLTFVMISLDGWDTVIIGFVVPELIKEWGVTKQALAPVLSAALFGLAVGAFVGGPVADRFGRKRVLVASVLVIGLGTLATAHAPSLEIMLPIRFITGLGLGAVMPNVVTLWSEYVPERRRSFLVTVVYSGFTVGAALCGFIAAWIIPSYGWRTMLTVGGALAVLCVPVMMLWLPESVAFLTVQNKRPDLIGKILSAIGRTRLPADAQFFLPAQPKVKGGAIGTILSRRYVAGTVLIWLCYFVGLFVLYLLYSWLPTMAKEAGYTSAQGAVMVGFLNWGGTLGSIAIGWLMDRFNRYLTVAVSFCMAAVSLWAVHSVESTFWALQVLAFAWGWFIPGTNTGMNALTARFYPTVARSTGLSWMHAFGRFGAIGSAFAGAAILSAGLGLSQILPIMAVAPLTGAVAVLIIAGLVRRWAIADESATKTEPSTTEVSSNA
ncbi:MFS transporter [Paraburkholderia susongensis]|uniref:MFS transporter, AAHS family, 4-hydroxybenzoate transporter n=1 Tax=Paraburkholderia susongensis TaxID=1515439 RepID=A0A1X7M589_9BURK|nr:aromatic acid/H+ symport family MFS transporter [Paraburkholderia susongensis]SMG61358.1 MFS transporter, AAHS family, 4-hydroxybenzoate transporter [Paraburkholderia susongensis]